MPDVVVKDQFTKNQTYIDSYIGVDTTKKTAAHQPNDKTSHMKETESSLKAKYICKIAPNQEL